MEAQAEADFRGELLRLTPRLRAFARVLTANHAGADDLAQDTVMRAWRGREGFEQGTNMEAWLFRILRNSHISGIRSSNRFKTDDLQKIEHTLASADDPSARLSLNDLRRALNSLPSAQREALVLIGAAGWSYEEAARHAGCAVGTLKSRVFRARRTLASSLNSGAVLPDELPPSEASTLLLDLASKYDRRQ